MVDCGRLPDTTLLVGDGDGLHVSKPGENVSRRCHTRYYKFVFLVFETQVCVTPEALGRLGQTAAGIIIGMNSRLTIQNHARLFLFAVCLYWALWALMVSAGRFASVPAYFPVLFLVMMLAGAAALLLYFWFWRRVLGGRGSRLLRLYWETDFRAWVYFFLPWKWAQIIRTAKWPVIPVGIVLAALLLLDLVLFIRFG